MDKDIAAIRYYFKIFTANRVFDVYQDFEPKPSWGCVYDYIKSHKSFKFFTIDDIAIYIETDAIIAMEISKQTIVKEEMGNA